MLYPISSPSLPQELAEVTIDHLWDDRRALQACSLVCKAWLPSSWFHLFHELGLDYHGSKCDVPEEFSSAKYVRMLMLEDLPATQFPRDLAQFTSTTSLFINECYTLTMGPAISSTFPNITCLELKNVHYQSFGEFATMFCSFPLLQTFTMRTGSHPWPAYHGAVIPHISLPRGLCTLNIDTCRLYDVLHWLLTQKRLPRLATVRVHYAPTSAAFSIATLLRSLGASLQHLELALADKGGADAFKQIDLRYNTQLQSLTIQKGWKQLLMHFLSDCSQHSKLTTVSLTTYNPGMADFDWTEMNSMIMDPKTPLHLSSVNVWVMARPWQLPEFELPGVFRFLSERQRYKLLDARLVRPYTRRSWEAELALSADLQCCTYTEAAGREEFDDLKQFLLRKLLSK
ncbi:hypothetical protein Hypma_000542 [Hypsizygus marmoreus]|uniref:F-box domain-containing protein n=1 Tax=Hypsizygus marmoreus TaxID=39966 RepID=A0A369J8B5_HYPMA|nr:hypothetical protein Hypma_000542 [Hypsizygus marmoreus]